MLRSYWFRPIRLVVAAAVVIALTAVGGCTLFDLTDGGDGQVPEPQEAVHMYVHSATSGVLVPAADEENVYILTLNDVSPSTRYHTDVPEEIVSHIETGAFVRSLNGGESRSAVIELMEGAEEADVLVVRLSDPAYDPQVGTLVYRAEVVLPDGAPEYLTRHAEEELTMRVDEALPQTFRSAQVYVDSPGPVSATDGDCVSNFRIFIVVGWIEVETCPDHIVVKHMIDGVDIKPMPTIILYPVERKEYCFTHLAAKLCITVTPVDAHHVKIGVKGCAWTLRWYCTSQSMGTFIRP